MLIKQKAYNITIKRAISLVVAIAFLANDLAFALPEKLYQDNSTLAIPSRLTEEAFRERFLTGRFILTDAQVNLYIKEQILREQEILKDKWNDERTLDLDVSNYVAEKIIIGKERIRNNVADLSKIKLVKITGLLARTGQFAHVGLTGRDYDGTPVMYVDGSFCNWENDALRKHETEEILQWEDLRVNILKIADKSLMRAWMIKNTDDLPADARAKLSGTVFEACNSVREIANIIHSRSHSIEKLYAIKKKQIGEIGLRAAFDLEKISSLFSYRSGDPEENIADAKKINIAAGPEAAASPVPGIVSESKMVDDESVSSSNGTSAQEEARKNKKGPYAIFARRNKIGYVKFLIESIKSAGIDDNIAVKRLRETVGGMKFVIDAIKYSAGSIAIISSQVSRGYASTITMSAFTIFGGGIARILVFLFYSARYPSLKLPISLYIMTLAPFNIGFAYTIFALLLPGQKMGNVLDLKNISYKVFESLYYSNLRPEISYREAKALSKNILRISWEIMEYQRAHFGSESNASRQRFNIRSASVHKDNRKKALNVLDSGQRVIFIDSAERLFGMARYIKKKRGTDILKRVYYYDLYRVFSGSRSPAPAGKFNVAHMFTQQGKVDPYLFRKMRDRRRAAASGAVPAIQIDTKKIREGLEGIGRNAARIMDESHKSVVWRPYEFPPCESLIECFIRAADFTNKIAGKEWSSSSEFINDLERIYSIIKVYKGRTPWYYHILDIVGETWGRWRRTVYLKKTFREMQRPLSREEAIELGVRTFYKVLKYQVHLDGNTRLAVLVANLIFQRNGIVPFILGAYNAAEYYRLTLDIKYGYFEKNYLGRIRALFFPEKPYRLDSRQESQDIASVGTHGDGMIRQGALAFEEMVRRLESGRFIDVTESADTKDDIAAVTGIVSKHGVFDGPIDTGVRALALDAVIAGPNDFCLGFNSHAPPVREELTMMLGSEAAFEKLFPKPTIVLANQILENTNDSIRREYICHELICHHLGHYDAIFAQQKLFPENYTWETGGAYLADEEGRMVMLDEPNMPAKGSLGVVIRDAIDSCEDRIVPYEVIFEAGKAKHLGGVFDLFTEKKMHEKAAAFFEKHIKAFTPEMQLLFFRYLLNSLDFHEYSTIQQRNQIAVLCYAFKELSSNGLLELSIGDYMQMWNVHKLSGPGQNVAVAEMIHAVLFDKSVRIPQDPEKNLIKEDMVDRLKNFLGSYSRSRLEHDGLADSWMELFARAGDEYIDTAVEIAKLSSGEDIFENRIFSEVVFPACARSSGLSKTVSELIMEQSGLDLGGELSSASEVCSAIFDDDKNAREFFRIASLLRKACPYDAAYHDPRPPLKYALDEGIIFKIGKNVYMTPVTESFRRHLVFSKDDFGEVRFAFEVLMPGEWPDRREVGVEKREDISFALIEASEDKDICPRPIFKKSFPPGSYKFYGCDFEFDHETPLSIMAFDYPFDGKRLDALTPAAIRQMAEQTGASEDKLSYSIIDQVARLTALSHAIGLIGHTLEEKPSDVRWDHHIGNFRVVMRRESALVTFVGDFGSFTSADEFSEAGEAREEDINKIAHRLLLEDPPALANILEMPPRDVRRIFNAAYGQSLFGIYLTGALQRYSPGLSGLSVFNKKSVMRRICEGGPIAIPRQYSGKEFSSLVDGILSGEIKLPLVYKLDKSHDGAGIFFIERDESGEAAITMSYVPAYPAFTDYLSRLAPDKAKIDREQATVTVRVGPDNGEIKDFLTQLEQVMLMETGDTGSAEDVYKDVFKVSGRAYETRYVAEVNMAGECTIIKDKGFSRIGASPYFSNFSGRIEARLMEEGFPGHLYAEFVPDSGVDTFERNIEKLIKAQHEYVVARIDGSGLLLSERERNRKFMAEFDVMWQPPAGKGDLPKPLLMELRYHFPEEHRGKAPGVPTGRPSTIRPHSGSGTQVLGKPAQLLGEMRASRIFSAESAKSSLELSGSQIREGKADSRRTIQRELAVLLNLGIVRRAGAKYHLASWLESLTDSQWTELSADLGLNKASPDDEDLKKTYAAILTIINSPNIPDKYKTDYFAHILIRWGELSAPARSRLPYAPSWHGDSLMSGRDGVTLTPEVVIYIAGMLDKAFIANDIKRYEYIYRIAHEVCFEAALSKAGIENGEDIYLLWSIYLYRGDTKAAIEEKLQRIKDLRNDLERDPQDHRRELVINLLLSLHEMDSWSRAVYPILKEKLAEDAGDELNPLGAQSLEMVFPEKQRRQWSSQRHTKRQVWREIIPKLFGTDEVGDIPAPAVIEIAGQLKPLLECDEYLRRYLPPAIAAVKAWPSARETIVSGQTVAERCAELERELGMADAGGVSKRGAIDPAVARELERPFYGDRYDPNDDLPSAPETPAAFTPTVPNKTETVSENKPMLEDLTGKNAGWLLKTLRKDAGLTQAEVAARAGISQPTVSNAERGMATPHNLNRIAYATAAKEPGSVPAIDEPMPKTAPSAVREVKTMKAVVSDSSAKELRDWARDMTERLMDLSSSIYKLHDEGPIDIELVMREIKDSFLSMQRAGDRLSAIQDLQEEIKEGIYHKFVPLLQYIRVFNDTIDRAENTAINKDSLSYIFAEMPSLEEFLDHMQSITYFVLEKSHERGDWVVNIDASIAASNEIAAQSNESNLVRNVRLLAAAPDTGAREEPMPQIVEAVDMMDTDLRPALYKGTVYEVRYNKERLESIGPGAVEAFDKYIECVKSRVQKGRPEDVKRVVKVLPWSGELFSVQSYEDMTKSKKIGEARIDMEGGLKDVPVDIVTMLNMIFRASNIPQGQNVKDYPGLADFIKATGAAVLFTPGALRISLPRTAPLTGGIKEYYDLVTKQLRQYA